MMELIAAVVLILVLSLLFRTDSAEKALVSPSHIHNPALPGNIYVLRITQSP